MKLPRWAAAALMPTLLVCLGCAGEDDEIAPLACDIGGRWELTESLSEGGCEGWEPFEGAILEIEQVGNVHEFQYRPPVGEALLCSGTPQGDPCLMELACSGSVGEHLLEVALEVEFDPEAGTLSGTERLEVIDLECEFTNEVHGQRLP